MMFTVSRAEGGQRSISPMINNLLLCDALQNLRQQGLLLWLELEKNGDLILPTLESARKLQDKIDLTIQVIEVAGQCRVEGHCGFLPHPFVVLTESPCDESKFLPYFVLRCAALLDKKTSIF